MKLTELLKYKSLRDYFILALKDIAEERILKMSETWNRGNFLTDYTLTPHQKPFFISKRFNGLEFFFYEESEKDHFPFLEINYGGFGLDPYIVFGRNFQKINESELEEFFEKTLEEKWEILQALGEKWKTLQELAAIYEKF